MRYRKILWERLDLVYKVFVEGRVFDVVERRQCSDSSVGTYTADSVSSDGVSISSPLQERAALSLTLRPVIRCQPSSQAQGITKANQQERLKYQSPACFLLADPLMRL